MALHYDLGKEGEQDAVNFLIENGHTILEQNFRYGHAEIDIISQKGDIIHIVEVKTSTSSAYGEPESFVNQQKIDLIVKAANNYILRKNLDVEVQFDIISIVKNSVEFSINYIEDAFYPF